MEVINFYYGNNPYGNFSNFFMYAITLNGKRWPTSEHYFQGQKFKTPQYQNKIRSVGSPMKAALLGRSRKEPLRRDWERVKDNIMRDAARAKPSQKSDLKEKLLGTGDALLVEHTVNDRYWCDGGDGSGKNMLGKILMEIRASLR